MKDRPPPSLYVPPHQRLRSVVSVPPDNVSGASFHDSKDRDHLTPTVFHLSPPLKSPPESQLEHKPPPARYVSAYDDQVSEEPSVRRFDMAIHPGPFPCSNMDEWRKKFSLLLRDDVKQEVISREKKDRRDFDKLATLATRMGLHSHAYDKVVVFSKVPLPNYRFDLDDKRPQREINLHMDFLQRVEAYLKEYLSRKPKRMHRLPDTSSSRSSSTSSITTDEGLHAQPELVAASNTTTEKDFGRSLQLRDQQEHWEESVEGRRMLESRRSLPAYKQRDLVLTALLQNQVIVISGETGCGKTTQIPQYILESEIKANRGAFCNIICTQPRKVSAISVSERVANERGEQLGESVGYKVRLEGVRGRDTRLLFCTTGVLLRRLLVDRNLRGVSHVIVDEIHERGMNEDFLLIILKDLLPRRPELKLILMSATLDAELFSSYFGGTCVINIPGFTYPVSSHFLEDILEMTGYKMTPHNQIDDYGQEKMWKMNKQMPRKRKSQIASVVEDALRVADFKKFSPETQESLSCWNPECIGFNLIEYLLFHICENEGPGGILVFMTGWDDISCLKEKLQNHPIFGNPDRVMLLACHGSMESLEQRLIFEEPAHGVRKIVLATNIAETSITINDVAFVIDCGKAKETSYDALNNAPCLLPSWISKASAQQRRGRASRVRPGQCYHLYPKCVYNAFAEYQLPEILRTPLQSLCLQIKGLNLGSISEFLSRALQSPDLLAVQKAIEYLKIIGALDENENLTTLGLYLSKLPMEPKHGKMLIAGAILGCLDPVLTIVAGLSVRDPFLTPMEKKDLAIAAKFQFSHDHSDHLALVRAYEGWKIAEQESDVYDYCWKNFLSVQSMRAIDSLRKEFFLLLKDTGLMDGNLAACNIWGNNEPLTRAVICYGLFPGICSVVHNEKSFSLKTMEDGQVLLHSNSVNARGRKIPYPWLVFNEKIKVNSVFLRDSTAVSDSALILFGGSISKGDIDGHLKMLGGYLEFFMKPAVAGIYQTLKEELDELIQSKLLNPKVDLQTHRELISVIRLFVSDGRCDGRFVFGHQVLGPIGTTVVSTQPTMLPRIKSGPGGDNSKSQLQTIATRAGYAPPMYKTRQLNNNKFQATVAFNDAQITGQPCDNKKSAEKDAAAEAIKWLMRRAQESHEYVNHMSKLLKKSKKQHP